jgi:hypothetical protein
VTPPGLGFDLSDVEAEARRVAHLERTARRAVEQWAKRFRQGWISAVEAFRNGATVDDLDDIERI